jgi:DNA-binding SARP family transcriptional activator
VSLVIACRSLGPVELTLDGTMAPSELLWKKHLALLLYLARSGPRGRTREHLIGLLWPESEEGKARHSLNVALGHIRRHLGDGAIDGAGGPVRLSPGLVRLDLTEFDELAGREDWSGAAALVSGEFLEGFDLPGASAFEDWLMAERAHWRARSVDVLVRHADGLLRSGHASDAVAVARRALQLDPAAERGARTLMRGLALAGDRAAALAEHARVLARLAELGAVPERATEELAERIAKQRLVRPGRPSPDTGSPAGRLPLAGREAELQGLLDAAAAAAAAPRSAVLIIEGEIGSGKTRLNDELLARLRLDGMAVSAARAVEADRSESESGVVVLARGGLLDAAGIAGAPPDAIATLAGALPEWAERFPAVGSSRQPLARALTEVVRAAAGEQPVVLAVDDAQWLDDRSVGTLVSLLRDLAAAPVIVVLTLSPHVPRPDLDDLRSRIGRDLGGAVVHLGPLTTAALGALARRLLPGYDAVQLDRVVRRVGVDSACLPLLAVELLRAVALGLDLGSASGAWPEPQRTLDQSLPGDLPDAVVAAIRIGFGRRSPDAQRVLAAAAALGDRVPAGRVAAALNEPLELVHRALDELEWHHWLVAEPRGYGFVARIVRQVVERDMLTPGQRRRLLEAVGPVT